MKLIPNAWQVAKYSYSQNATAIASALIGGYQVLPDKLQDALPVGVVMTIAFVVLIFGWVGRLIAQPDLAVKPADPSKEVS